MAAIPPNPSDRQRRTLLLIDVVESVRLMAAHELRVIAAWQGLLDLARNVLLPLHEGRLVKSLGDGLLAELPSPRQALAAARALQAALPQANVALPADAQLQLRCGLHVADVVVHELDVFGDGVNLSARLCALAPPGGIVASAAACDELSAGVDAQMHDLGLCYLKHWPEPVRAYRLDPVDSAFDGVSGERALAPPAADWRPALAVWPEAVPGADASVVSVLSVLADDLSDLLCQDRGLRVIAPLSVRTLQGAALTPPALGKALHVPWLVTLGLRAVGGGWRIRVALVQAASGEQVWSAQVLETAEALASGQHAQLPMLAMSLAQAMRDESAEAVVRRPLPTLESCALLQGAVARLYRSAPTDVDSAEQALGHLTDRHPRSADPLVWQARLHLLRTLQRWTPDTAREVSRAKYLLARAMDLQPEHGLAMSLTGHWQVLEQGDHPEGRRLVEGALVLAPEQSQVWLHAAQLFAHADQGERAWQAASEARRLDPLHPQAYLYDLFAAYAALVRGDWSLAAQLGSRACSANRLHVASYPVAVAANAHAGRLDDARQLLERYRALNPQIQWREWSARSTAAARVRDLIVDGLRAAGMP